MNLRSIVLSRPALLAAGALCTAMVCAPPAEASPAPAFAQGHPYRHGVVPPRGPHAAALPDSTDNLTYGGGNDGIGVTTGIPRVYVVFYGSQWGTEGANSSGLDTFSGDPVGMAPYLQAFLKGIGQTGDSWSAVMTQYCEGAATGAQDCSAGDPHVGYAAGGALAGVLYDNSAPAPQAPTATQLGQEAEWAATQLGNTTAQSNRNVQYVVVSPTGTNPDGFNTSQGQFCAWHDWTGDPYVGVTSSNGPVAFTNLPYVTDAGTACGQYFVNAGAAGKLDGVSIVEGHEFAETLTDQFPSGGWLDSNGEEDGDKCAWDAGNGDQTQDISLSTGSFAVQPTWGNDYSSGTGGCEISHSLPQTNTITVTNPGDQAGAIGQSASLQIAASDSGGSSLDYGAAGLPAGLSIDPSSGVISGTPTKPGTFKVTVTATDSTGSSGATSFAWNVADKVTITPPATQKGTVGTPAALQVRATSSARSPLQYSAQGLPPGLVISPTTGRITGTPYEAGSYTVLVSAQDALGASSTAQYTWNVARALGTCVPAQLISNPGFERGYLAPWMASAGVLNPKASEPAHSGQYDAWLGGWGSPHTDWLEQTIRLPANCTTYQLSFWLHIDTADPSTTAQNDTMTVQVLKGSQVLGTLDSFSNLNAAAGYQQHTYDLTPYLGQSVTLKFTAVETDSLQTSFVVDDAALNLS